MRRHLRAITLPELLIAVATTSLLLGLLLILRHLVRRLVCQLEHLHQMQLQ